MNDNSINDNSIMGIITIFMVAVIAIIGCVVASAVRRERYYQAVCEQQVGGQYESHHEGWIVCSNIHTRDVWTRLVDE